MDSIDKKPDDIPSFQGLPSFAELRRTTREALDGTSDAVRDVARDATGTARDAAHDAADAARDAADTVRGAWTESIDDVREQLPSFDDVLAQAALLPGARVGRENCLRDALRKQPAGTVDAAIRMTPARAGVSKRTAARLARKAGSHETRLTTIISIAAGVPGGAAAAATIPADLVQFYAHLIRVIQKLSYLYGWRGACELSGSDMDERTRCAITLFLGVMSGVPKADEVMGYLSLRRDLANPGILFSEKNVVRAASEVGEALSLRMAHRMTGQVVGKAMPLAGAVISGAITHGGFADMVKRLRTKLDEWW